MKCLACQDGDATEVPVKLRTTTIPCLCADCFVRVKEAEKRGWSLDLSREEDREELLEGLELEVSA